MKTPEEWIIKNQILLSKYKCKYVAISNRIIASGDRLEDVDRVAKENGKNYVLYYVPKSINRVRILPIHIKSLSVHEWQPLYQIELISMDGKIYKEEALIDSGADISCVPYQLGIDIGFEKYLQEVPLKACGLGGEVEYYQRELSIKIDGHKLNIPLAWVQSGSDMELIIGRAVVFDLFDITFKQADEKLDFKWREE